MSNLYCPCISQQMFFDEVLKLCVYYLVMYCRRVTLNFRIQISNLSVLFFHVLTETFVWKRVLTMGTPPSARDSHTCSSWKNKIIVIGGEDASDYYLSDVHVLDTGYYLSCVVVFPKF